MQWRKDDCILDDRSMDVSSDYIDDDDEIDPEIDEMIAQIMEEGIKKLGLNISLPVVLKP